MVDLGPPLAATSGMPVFSTASLVADFFFGSIGFVGFIYGKRMHLWKVMFCGLALMVYPYFFESAVAVVWHRRGRHRRRCFFCATDRC